MLKKKERTRMEIQSYVVGCMVALERDFGQLLGT